MAWSDGSGARLGRAVAGSVLGAALLTSVLLAGWADAAAGCVDRPCTFAPNASTPAAGTPAPARRAQAVRAAQDNAYRASLPVSVRGANLTASGFDPISVALPTGGGTVTTSDRGVSLALPPGLAAAGTQLSVQPATPPDDTGVGGLRAVRVDLTAPDGSPISQLGQAITVTLRFTAADLARAGVASASDLQIRYSSDGGATWTDAATSVDAASGQAVTSANHLTIFALVGLRRPTGYLPPTAVPTATPTVVPTATAVPFYLAGRGVAISGSTDPASVQNVLNQTYAGSWYAYNVGSDGPAGRVQMLRTGRNELPTSQDATIRAVAAAKRGSYWIVGNEPNVADQDWDSTKDFAGNVAAYVAAYKRYRTLVLAADPTAKFVVGNTLNVTKTCGGCVGYPLGRDFLDAVRASANWSEPQYGGVMPVDVWGFHAYRIDWYAPPMTNAQEPKDEIAAFRAYLDAIPTEQSKPIWITEFGVIWGYQDWCWAGPYDKGASYGTNANYSNNPISNECHASAGRYVFDKYGGPSPETTYPKADDSIDEMIASLSSWLYQNSAAMHVDRWFIFTDYGSPDPYTGVYGGISLMDGTGASAQATRFGRTYASAR